MEIMAEPVITPSWWQVDLDESKRKKKENPKAFKVLLKPLNGIEQMSLRDHVHKTHFDRYDYTSEGLKLALTYGLKDWMNLRDADGVEVDFSIRNAYERLPSDILERIAYEITIRSTVPEKARKKS